MRKCAAHPIPYLHSVLIDLNGAVHSKYTEQLTHSDSASQTVKKIVSVKVLVLGYLTVKALVENMKLIL